MFHFCFWIESFLALAISFSKLDFCFSQFLFIPRGHFISENSISDALLYKNIILRKLQTRLQHFFSFLIHSWYSISIWNYCEWKVFQRRHKRRVKIEKKEKKSEQNSIIVMEKAAKAAQQLHTFICFCECFWHRMTMTMVMMMKEVIGVSMPKDWTISVVM